MPYAYPKYPAAIFTDTDYPDVVDDVNWIKGWLVNALKEELQAVLTELGINPRGSHTDVKARLDAIEWFIRTLIDYMEYSSDELAQAAYVSSDPGEYGSDVTPKMTSNTEPSGVASASKEYAAAYFAFDNTIGINNKWFTASEAPGWLQYQFPTSKVIARYTLQDNNESGYQDRNPKDWTFKGSNNGSDWTTLDTQSGITFTQNEKKTFSFSNLTPYTYYRIEITKIDGGAGIAIGEMEMMETTTILQCYSEATIKQQGSYSLKGIAKQTDSLDETLTRTVSPTIDLSGFKTISYDMRASRTGSNIKIGIHNSNGTITETTPNVGAPSMWETPQWDISGVADANKNAIDQIIITIVNADRDNTFYLDNIFAKLE